jgi:hypothetical protein
MTLRGICRSFTEFILDSGTIKKNFDELLIYAKTDSQIEIGSEKIRLEKDNLLFIPDRVSEEASLSGEAISVKIVFN